MLPAIAQVCSLSSSFEKDVEDYAAGHVPAIELWLGKLETFLETHTTSDVLQLLVQLVNAKKIVEVELKAKGTPLHAATVVGDTVGDPFKDTSSVAMNPVIKFTTLFGLLAVELAVKLSVDLGRGMTNVLALAFFLVSLYFVWRSFYGMRIGGAHE